MNMVEARVSDGALRFADVSLPLANLGPEAARLPERVILGVRPEHLSLVESGSTPSWSIEGDVVVEENLGAEVVVFIPVDAAPIETDEIRSIHEGETEALLAGDARTTFAARLPSGTRQHLGGRIRLALHPERCYFFDPETGESLMQRRVVDAPLPVMVP